MPYLKLLTVLAGLMIMTACGGSATPANNNTGGDNNTGDNTGGDNNGNGGEQPVVNPCANGACVEYADWLAVAAPSVEFTVPATNEFLRGTATGLQDIGDSNSTAVTFATAKYDSLDLGGESADGFAYYSFAGNHYTGILLNTNLGAPLTATSAVALWRGQFSVLEGGGTVVSSSFVLGVSFTDTATGGTITGETGLQDYAFEGSFDARGVIDGTITRSVVVEEGDSEAIVKSVATRAGTLTGLIGFDGAVGAFHSNAGVEDSYYGGFVARATRPVAVADTAPALVQYEDWAAIVSPEATPNTTARRNQFLQGTPADAPSNKGLNAGVGYRVNSGQPQPTAFIVDFENGSSRFRLTGIAGGQAADGFAIFRGTIGDVRHFYASILPTTNLGVPITTATGTADWPGRGVIDFGGLDSAFEDFVLTVDFGKREVSSPASSGASLSLKGTWDERGVITGTVLNAEYLDDARTMLDVDKPNVHGILTGLIGQEGAVGVFHRNNDGIGEGGFSGGFIAAPPDDS